MGVFYQSNPEFIINPQIRKLVAAGKMVYDVIKPSKIKHEFIKRFKYKSLLA
jgi:hypothetical protein